MAAPGIADRLGVTLLFSVLAHAVVALGLTFDYEKAAPRLPSLDVILVQSASGERPDKADFLAQASNSGGGDAEQPLRPSERLSSPVPKATEGIAPVPTEDAAPRPTPARPDEMLTRQQSDFSVRTDREAHETPPVPEAAQRDALQRRLEMARLAEELQRESQRYAKRPKRKYISANTREYAYAAYMRAWVARVERIGNLNYPDDARRNKLQGEVILTVGLGRDGSLRSVDVIKSSGHKALDEAAERSIHLAAPFPVVPDTDEKIDELYITRTWQFLPGDVLRTQ
ncbi:energy transducer TonB [Dokdonella koreensis]|uniref:Ferric siderophore transport system, periplasmic binding protein TonB n=1 Tax=Dokdonella koreensis DS-123 TaxID=1300342 RepID=A0A160DS18_9GAMM|nr:energy transducer TonB [Dokdonella koreensis]ANB16834.1 Ferric siderophore transport system, periplasmic binding protein TonB [Dokdonella koreensis DS-123]